jgi:hypothetical protein
MWWTPVGRDCPVYSKQDFAECERLHGECRVHAPHRTEGSQPPRAGALAWPRFYGAASVFLSFRGWAGEEGEYADFLDFHGGTHLAGFYAVFDNMFHIGGYFSVMVGTFEHTDLHDTLYSGGISMKMGSSVGQRLWIGGVLDLGGLLGDFGAHLPTMKGFTAFPRVQVDVLLLGGTGFKMAMFWCVGPQVSFVVQSSRGGPSRMVQISTQLGVGLGG